MKLPTFTHPLSSLSLAITALLAAHPAGAADYTWDTKTSPGVTGGDGTWNTSTANWTTDIGKSNVSWNTLTPGTAVFGGTAGVVKLGKGVQAEGLTFNTTGYELKEASEGLTFTLGGTGTITSGLNITTTINTSIAGSVGLTKAGAGTVILAKSSDYTGDTTISAGALQLDKDNALPATTNVKVSSSGTLDLNGCTSTLAGLAGSGAVTNSGGKNGASAALLLVGNLNASSEFSGVIENHPNAALSLDKVGTGTLTLSGRNTYTGTTDVDAGSLLINGDNSAAKGTVTVASKATLGGTGTVGGATTIKSGGIGAPGAAPGAIGTQTFNGALTYDSGSTFKWDLSGATLAIPNGTNNQGSYDEVVASGAVSVMCGAIFEVNLAGLAANGSNFSGSFWDSHRTWSNVFTGAGVTSLNGSLFRFGGSDGNGMMVAADGTVANQGRFSFSGSTLNWDAAGLSPGGLTPVPEPGTWVALGSLVGCGLCLRNRRRAAR